MQANLKAGESEMLDGKCGCIPIIYRKSRRARRYILQVNEGGEGGRVTIPRGGQLDEARRFARRNLGWLEERLGRLRDGAKSVFDESSVLFRGETVPLQVLLDGRIVIGEASIEIDDGVGDVQARVAQKLWQMAAREFPAQVLDLAAQHGLRVSRVSVRNQRSRWGSCSARGVISLNWRLIQAPEFVRDYVIVHELMHLREMNHSKRFWKLVCEAFPHTQSAEKWLSAHGAILRSWRPCDFAAAQGQTARENGQGTAR